MSISNQLLDIAQNIPKIHKAGQLAILNESKYMHPTVSDFAILVNDVSVVEHNLNVRLTSDTITDFSNIKVSRYGKNLLNITPMLSDQNWRKDSTLNVSGYWNYPIKGLTPNIEYTLSMSENGFKGVADNGFYCSLRNSVSDLTTLSLISSIFDRVLLPIGSLKDICLSIAYLLSISSITCGISFCCIFNKFFICYSLL